MTRPGYEGLHTSADEQEERRRYLEAWGEEPPEAQVTFGRVEQRCEQCGAAWVTADDGVGRCERDSSHIIMVERAVEPIAAVAEPGSEGRSWRPWRRPPAPEAIGPDAEAQHALESLSEQISTLLVSLAAAEAATRGATQELESRVTAEAMRGQTVKREWKPAFRRVAGTLQSLSETIGDVSIDNADLPRIRATLQSLQYIVRAAVEEQ